MFDPARYVRQIQLPNVGLDGQRKLNNARVLVVGAGGLSASLLPILAASGVGYLRIYDADQVELSNLHRQIVFRMTDLGHFKAIAVAQHLKQLNPEINIEPHPEHIYSSNLEVAIKDIDLVIDAADRFATTYLLSDICFSKKIPLISASVLAEQGYVGGFCGKDSPSYHALFPELPQQAASCQSAGVLASTVATLASLQAHMVLNVILNGQHSALGQLLRLDLEQWHISSLRFDQLPEPEDPLLWLDRGQLQPDDVVLELREHSEIDDPIPNAIPTRLDHLPLHLLSNQRIVCVCKSGIRAAKAAKLLKQRGVTQVFIMAA